MEGDVEIKLSPPKCLSVLQENKDIDLWNSAEKYTECDIIVLPLKKGKYSSYTSLLVLHDSLSQLRMCHVFFIHHFYKCISTNSWTFAQ